MCKECDDEQESDCPRRYFIRWGKADIEIRGCEIHVKELIGFCRKHMERAS